MNKSFSFQTIIELFWTGKHFIFKQLCVHCIYLKSIEILIFQNMFLKHFNNEVCRFQEYVYHMESFYKTFHFFFIIKCNLFCLFTEKLLNFNHFLKYHCECTNDKHYATFWPVSLYSFYIYLHVHVSAFLCTTDGWIRFMSKAFWDKIILIWVNLLCT